MLRRRAVDTDAAAVLVSPGGARVAIPLTEKIQTATAREQRLPVFVGRYAPAPSPIPKTCPPFGSFPGTHTGKITKPKKLPLDGRFGHKPAGALVIACRT